MKKILILFCITFFLASPSFAQSSMTDEQIMEFVISENDNGTPHKEIVSKLIKKGVSVERLKGLYEKQQKQKSSNQMGKRDVLDGKLFDNRSRKNNGDKKVIGARKDFAEGKNKSVSSGFDDFSFEMEDSTFMWEDFEPVSPKKKVFGHDIFNKQKLNFEPEMNIATPADYKIGPGDVVFIDVWGATQKTFNSVVSPDGNIDIEGVGPISISGLSVAEANHDIKVSLGRYYEDSHVKLTVGQTKTISVNVMGEVVAPGTYTLSAFSTVFHALYMSGGVNDIGTLRNIKVYRKNKLISTIDIYDYILRGEMSANVKLQTGDVVIVGPYDCLVNVAGKVKRPMFYEMKKDESVGTLLDFAGGFAGDAYRKTLRLIRKSGGEMSVFSLDEFERSNFKVCDGDSLFVDSVLDRYSNMVELKGSVRRPGMYQMDGSIATVRQVLEAAGGLNEDAFGGRVIMHRRKADRTLEVVSFDADAIISHRVPDISLRNEDIIFVPSREDVLGERVLKIVGEVMYPGDYDFAENMTIEDLILQAGGLTDAASVVKVDVSRRIRDNVSLSPDSVIAKHYTFSLKDGFVVNGKPGFVLAPFDEVFVRRSPGYVKQEHVKIDGEVAFSGEYVLTKKNLRLSDLVKAAGGLTPEAYPAGARLERRLTDAEKIRQRTMVKLATRGDSVDLKKLDLGETRYVGINLDKALDNPGNDAWDIALEKGDRLIIPQFNNTVSISGEVMFPNTVVFKKGEKLKYYINQAGGYSANARSSRVFAINMNGTVTKVSSSKDIHPGCEIIVPSRSKRNRLSFSEIVGMGTMTASLAAVIASLVK